MAAVVKAQGVKMLCGSYLLDPSFGAY